MDGWWMGELWSSACPILSLCLSYLSLSLCGLGPYGWVNFDRLVLEASNVLDVTGYENYAELMEFASDHATFNPPVQHIHDLKFKFLPDEGKMAIKGPMGALWYFRLRGLFALGATSFDTEDEPNNLDCLNIFAQEWVITSFVPNAPEYVMTAPHNAGYRCLKLYYLAGYGGAINANAWGAFPFRGCNMQRVTLAMAILRAWMCEEAFKMQRGVHAYWQARVYAPYLPKFDSFANRGPLDGHWAQNKTGAVQMCFDLWRDNMAGNEFEDDYHITRNTKLGPHCMFTHNILMPHKARLVGMATDVLGGKEDVGKILPGMMMSKFSTTLASSTISQFMFLTQVEDHPLDSMDCPIQEAIQSPAQRYGFMRRYPRSDCQRVSADPLGYHHYTRSARQVNKDVYGSDYGTNARWIWFRHAIDDWVEEKGKADPRMQEQGVVVREALNTLHKCVGWDQYQNPCIGEHKVLYFAVKDLVTGGDLAKPEDKAMAFYLMMEVVHAIMTFMVSIATMANYGLHSDFEEVEIAMEVPVDVNFTGYPMCQQVDECFRVMFRSTSGRGGNLHEQMINNVLPSNTTSCKQLNHGRRAINRLLKHLRSLSCNYGCVAISVGKGDMLDQNWFHFLLAFLSQVADCVNDWHNLLGTLAEDEYIEGALRKRMVDITAYHQGMWLENYSLNKERIDRFMREMISNLRLGRARRDTEQQYAEFQEDLNSIREGLVDEAQSWQHVQNLADGECECAQAKTRLEIWDKFHGGHGMGAIELPKNATINDGEIGQILHAIF